jgi:hypothetical protein
MSAINATYAPEVLSQFSVSRLYRYLTCPESYRLHYLERWRPRVQSAGLVFGAGLHVVLADFFRSGIEPVKNFLTLWEGLRNVTLAYSSRESWEELKEKGENLLTLFVAEEAPKITNVSAVEKSFEFQVSDLAMPFTGIIDLVADINGKRTVVDFKTSASRYEPHESILSDQLTAYFLAEPDAKQVAFCVFVKTKKPKIEWFFAQRDGETLVEFLAKVSHVISEIEEERFYKRPGRQCGICDFLPICLRNGKEVEETLIKIERYKEVISDELRKL